MTKRTRRSCWASASACSAESDGPSCAATRDWNSRISLSVRSDRGLGTMPRLCGEIQPGSREWDDRARWSFVWTEFTKFPILAHAKLKEVKDGRAHASRSGPHVRSTCACLQQPSWHRLRVRRNGHGVEQ